MAMVYGASQCNTYQDVLDALASRAISARVGRDAVRCMLMEEVSQCKVVTIDNVVLTHDTAANASQRVNFFSKTGKTRLL